MVEQLQQQYIAFLRPDETAADLLARSNAHPVVSGVPPLDVHGGLHSGQLVELAGPSGSGKTEMLTQVIAHAILPQQWQQHHVGGMQVSALLLDLDTRFDLLRLIQILQSRIHHLGVRGSANADAVQDALRRFHLIRCHNTFELMTALVALPSLLPTITPQVKVLLVDNVDAHYWMDRAVRPTHAGPALTPATTATVAAELLTTTVLQHKLLCLASRCVGGLQGDGWQLQGTIGRAWQDAVAKRMLLKDAGTARLCKWEHEAHPMVFTILEHCIALVQ